MQEENQTENVSQQEAPVQSGGYSLNIADRTGHTVVSGLTLEAAVESITKTVEESNRWVFVNGEPFNFAGSVVRSEENTTKLTELLGQATETAIILLTGALVGGSYPDKKKKR